MTRVLAVRLAAFGALASGLVALSPTSAESQVRVPKWEIEFHGTFATANSAPANDSVKTTPQGPTFTLGDGTTPTRAVHSWYFGSGASLLNQVLGFRGLSEKLPALDSVAWPTAGRRPGVQAGARIARRMTEALWFEFSADLGLDPIGFAGEAKDRIEDTRAGFVTAFTALNNSTPTLTANPTITSTATVASGGHRLITTGVLQFRATAPGLKSYVLAGAGFTMPLGRPTSLELVGRYQLSTPGGAKFDETDTTILTYRSAASLVMVGGFGFIRELSSRSGFRAETRVLLGRSRLEVLLDTAPSTTTTTPTGAAILNSTNPGLQFTTNGLRTNLSAPALNDFSVVTATGFKMQWVISAGYFRRF